MRKKYNDEIAVVHKIEEYDGDVYIDVVMITYSPPLLVAVDGSYFRSLWVRKK